ncbi:ABC transporter substrate-binding protein [Pseudofrankia sp. BMG5.37]|uniref:ABC transporter substrate-binding protein n=1 Tax=Pseudofrankia sp. BMG5.37 TaxID=3050035 RepID=UPI00289444FC|nr:ABC transporter substrate-binding protein [Pseudofrankia sp. BMG5.37]MDT3438909.1 ABC transporter substrate-binding protein [Pseudofrankia sp. BMG5.37]
MKRRLAGGLAAALAVTLALAACSSSDDETTTPGGGASSAAGLTPVKLQLQWFTQAQFAGYIAAKEKGYYKDAGLDVSILEGGTDIVPQTVLAQGKADFAIAWVPKALASREQGAAITDIAQIFQRSGTLQVSFKDKNITTPADLKGKKVGDWGFGNEYELFAAMTKAGVDPSKDITLVQQQFDMKGLLSGDIDAAQAMSYNEYAQVLEATNPATGKLYQPSDFNTMNWNDVGTAMLQDAIWANTDKLQGDKAYQDTATKFVTASIKGWIYCRDNPTDCRDLVVAAGSKLGKSHQFWQVNEINKLIWPSPDGIGLIDKTKWDQTVTIAKGTKNADGDTVLKGDPEGLAYTNDYVTKALADLKGQGVDVTGSGFKPETVTLEAGGV